MKHVVLFFCSLPVFTSMAQNVPVKIDANPAQGFNWPYYLYVPARAGASTTLLVEPNNTGSSNDDFAVHDAAALATATSEMPFAADVGCPLLVPVFPRPDSNSEWQIYTQALDRDTLLTTLPDLQRIDLQLIAMIDDARAKLAVLGKTAGPKVLIMGFSASGMFSNRFTFLHPDRVQAAAIGSPGGWPLAPVATWQGQTLRYNVGVSDVATLTGSTPDLATYVAVPQYFYLGDQDTNDSVPYTDGYDPEDATLVNQLFGTTPVARWPKAQEIYNSIGANAQFVLYPGVGHTQTPAMANDVKRFFFPGRTFSIPHILADMIPSSPVGKFRIEWATIPGLSYQVESSQDLQQWSEQGMPVLNGDGLVQSFETPSDPSPHFFRIRSIYTPATGAEGRFIVIWIGSGQPLSLSCTGLDSGTVTSSEGSAGTFTFGGQPAHGVFNMTTGGLQIPSGSQLSGDFDSATGLFTGEFLPPGGSAIPLQNQFEMLTVP